jgi:hypothetical protein
MTKQSWMKALAAALVFLAATADRMVWPETVELVTYYPTSTNTGGEHLRAVTVGPSYQATNLNDGEALIQTSLGIGPGLASGLVDLLRVQGTAGQNNSVVFLPGAGGTLAVGIGGAGVAGTELTVSNNATASNPNADLWVDRTGANPSTALVSAQADSVVMGSLSNDPLSLITNNTTRMTILPNGNIGIGVPNPQTPFQVGVSSLFVQNDQGGNLEIGGSNAIANPVINGTPYIDFHFGTGAAQDYNARIINNANNQLSFFTSADGVTPALTVNAANVGIGNTYAPGSAVPNALAGNLDVNDVFVRSRNLWLTQMAGGRMVAVNTVANFANFVNFNNNETVIGNIAVTATGRPLLIVVSYIVCNETNPQKGFQSRIRVDGTGINGAIVIQHGGGVQSFICEGGTVVCVHTPAAGPHTYYFTLRNGTNNQNLRGQATQISVTELAG